MDDNELLSDDRELDLDLVGKNIGGWYLYNNSFYIAETNRF